MRVRGVIFVGVISVKRCSRIFGPAGTPPPKRIGTTSSIRKANCVPKNNQCVMRWPHFGSMSFRPNGILEFWAFAIARSCFVPPPVFQMFNSDLFDAEDKRVGACDGLAFGV